MSLTKRIWTTVVLLAVLAGAGWGAFYTYRLVQRRKRLAEARTDEKPLKVAVERVRVATLERKTAVTGEVKAIQVVDVVPKVVGCLEKLRLPDGTLIDEGTVIKADPVTKALPVIVVIEHASLDAGLQQAAAALEVAKAAQERVAITLADALRDKKRIEKLFKKSVATQNELDKAAIAHAQLAAGLQLAKAQVVQATAAARLARIILDDATIAAPIAGVVTKKYIDEGNMVGPAQPLVRIEQIETVKVIGGVSERYLSALVVGKTPAEITVDAHPDEKFTGSLCRVAESVDPATRTAEVEVRIPNPGFKLKPGMFARISLVLERRADVLVVPDRALLRGDRTCVYVINNSKAYRRVITLGLSVGGRYEVLSGLKAADRIIVRGQRQLRPGQQVNAVEEGGQ